MKNEISAVVFFLSKLLRNNEKLSKGEIEMFSEELSRILHEKYLNHWYPESPTKGQAYRCIRVNKFQGVDPDLQRACYNSGLVYEELGLPKEITLWVDPCEVCCRYGEKNPSFVVASFESKDDRSETPRYPPERVTSDYHSGSSSSDDEMYISKKTPPTPVIANAYDAYQLPEFVLHPPPPPSWSKNPKRKQSSHYHYQPRYLSGYQEERTKVYGQVPWLPPVMQNERNHWTSLHMLSTSHQCLV
ncbi:protein BTG3 isoform X2 [Mixophyes fleayi]|uniref:protein BTG3 isoform X2 n=1 Tax=Mixophyes fleayi TaxID=3061075 RepID=UPI003F4E276F